jgi:3-oxoacyl-[acyl-carrier protein] reductase
MMRDSLRGRTALVTGSSRGIGAAISRALAEAEAAVALNFRERADSAQDLADELRQDRRSCHDRAGRRLPDGCGLQNGEVIKSELGAVDILVNNAGIAITRGSTMFPKPILIKRSHLT